MNLPVKVDHFDIVKIEASHRERSIIAKIELSFFSIFLDYFIWLQ